ncbi:MAG: hypothetical protein J0L93_09295 [Deltaproteobacteria bacterium]|nr:hypothetical protein [Deltaproteobacteria bacterium]
MYLNRFIHSFISPIVFSSIALNFLTPFGALSQSIESECNEVIWQKEPGKALAVKLNQALLDLNSFDRNEVIAALDTLKSGGFEKESELFQPVLHLESYAKFKERIRNLLSLNVVYSKEAGDIIKLWSKARDPLLRREALKKMVSDIQTEEDFIASQEIFLKSGAADQQIIFEELKNRFRQRSGNIGEIVFKLIFTENDPAKRKILFWLIAGDDSRKAGYALEKMVNTYIQSKDDLSPEIRLEFEQLFIRIEQQSPTSVSKETRVGLILDYMNFDLERGNLLKQKESLDKIERRLSLLERLPSSNEEDVAFQPVRIAKYFYDILKQNPQHELAAPIKNIIQRSIAFALLNDPKNQKAKLQILHFDDSAWNPNMELFLVPLFKYAKLDDLLNIAGSDKMKLRVLNLLQHTKTPQAEVYKLALQSEIEKENDKGWWNRNDEIIQTANTTIEMLKQ